MAITNKDLAETIKNILGGTTREIIVTPILRAFTEEDLLSSIENDDFNTFIDIIGATGSEFITTDVSDAILSHKNSTFLFHLEMVCLSSCVQRRSFQWCMNYCHLSTFKEYLRIYTHNKIDYHMLSVSLCFGNDLSEYVQEMHSAGDPVSKVTDMKDSISKGDFEIFSYIAKNLTSAQLTQANVKDCKSFDNVIEFIIKMNQPGMLIFTLAGLVPLPAIGDGIRHDFLVHAISCKSYECMQVLLRYSPPTDSEKISSDIVARLFEKAIATGELKYVEALVDAGFSVTVGGCSCDTPLFRAAADHHDDMVKYFIEKGVNINSFDSYDNQYQCGRGQFYRMISIGNVEGFKILRENGGDWTVTTGETSVFNSAAYLGGAEFIQVMMTGGYPLNDEIRGQALCRLVDCVSPTVSQREFETINMLIDEGANMDSRGYMNRTALYFACRRKNHDLIRTLLFAGADPLAMDDCGKTPLECINDASFREEMKNLVIPSSIPTPPNLPNLPAFKGYTPKKKNLMDDVPTTPKPFAAEPEVEESEDMKTLRRLTRDLQDLKGLAAALRCQLENLRAMR